MIKYNKKYKVYVSDDGTAVYNTKGKKLRFYTNGKKRLKVRPYFDNKFHIIGVNRLVYETFVGKIAKNENIIHIDGDQLNNNINNLKCIEFIEKTLV